MSLRRTLGQIRTMCLAFGDLLVGAFTNPDNHEFSVLLVRLDSIGDFFVWLDQAKEYRKIYPGKKIMLVGNKSWAGIAGKLPYFDAVIPVDVEAYVKNPVYRLKKNLEIGRYAFETVINPMFSRSFLISDAIVRVTKSKQKIGFNGNLSSMRAWQKWSIFPC